MTDKEFKRLSRAQLIDIIYQLQLQIDELNEELIAEHMHEKYPGIWEPTDEWNKEWANDREWS